MKITSTKPVTSLAQNQRMVAAVANGDTVVLDESADAELEAGAVLQNYLDLTDDQRAVFRTVIERTEMRGADAGSDWAEVKTALIGGIGGAGVAILSGRSDVVSIVGGFAVGTAAGYTGHQVGATIMKRIDSLEFEVKLDAEAGGRPSLSAHVKGSS